MNLKEELKFILKGLPSRVKIEGRYIGPQEPVFVIAEIGINHNGDIDLAKKLIDAAKDAGADAVKFQKRTIEEILTKEGRDKPYTSPNAFAPTYGEHRKKLEFSETQYREIKKYAQERGLLFFASVWDTHSADLMEDLNANAFKIPSADLINTPLLEHVAKKKNAVLLLSTGMSTEEEIEGAVRAILRHNHRLIIFHCLSLYPSPEEKINLDFMDVLRRKFAPLPVGYSGHELGSLPTIAAVAKGACIVERHITLDRTMKGSDHSGSLEPAQFKELVSVIRQVEKIRGVPEKIIFEELKPLREKLAKSIIAREPIRKGTIISSKLLGVKGPGSGIPPRMIPEILGRVAAIDIEPDHLLPLEALHWKQPFFSSLKERFRYWRARRRNAF